MTDAKRQLLRRTVHVSLLSVATIIVLLGAIAGYEIRGLLVKPEVVVRYEQPVDAYTAEKICRNHHGHAGILWIRDTAPHWDVMCEDDTAFDDQGNRLPK